MVDATYIDNNRVQIIKDDDIAFDTNRPSVVLFPDGYNISINRNIDFPSPIQNNAYYRAARGTGSLTKCELWSTLIWQEWGPNEPVWNERYFSQTGVQDRNGPTTRPLPRDLIATVPSGTNYIDVRLKLTRTKTPANFAGTEPPILFFPQNEWITSPGGSFPTEYFFPLARHFDIVLEGTNVYLDRYQSVANANNVNAPGNHPQRDISNNQSGWNSDGVAGANTNSDGTSRNELNPKSNYYLASLIQIKDYSANGTKRPGGSNACTGNFPDLQSIYNADIVITPGIYKQ